MIALDPGENNSSVSTAWTNLRWGAGSTTRDRIVADASAFDFYQAVRVLSVLHSDKEESRPLQLLPVRFRSQMDANFPGADIHAVTLGSARDPFAEMVVEFLGLAGAHGPLPAVYTEQMLRRGDSALRDFLNIFNHRLIVLVYHIHEMHHPELTHQAPDQGLAANHIFAMFGWGRDPDSAIRNRLAFPDRALLNYSGLLAQRPRSAVGLQILMGDYFQVPVAVEEFCGAWFDLSADQWTRMGTSGSGANQALGNGAILGKRVWDQNAGVTIRLGPLDLKTFKKFLPGGAAYKALGDLARVYLGDEIDCSFKLELRDDQIPWTELHRAANSSVALGRLSWLHSGRSGDSAQVQAGAFPIKGRPLKQGGR